MLSLANRLSGTVQVKICGAMPEKFINLCAAHGIHLWNVRYEADCILACLRLGDLIRVRPFARQTRSRLRIIGKAGLPFYYKRLKRRKMLAAGAVIFCVLLYILTSLVWFVDVQSTGNVPAAVIRQVAAEAGLRQGVWKNSVSVRQVEKRLLATLPELAWVGIRLEGTRAMVEVAEKKLPPAIINTPADVVAQKDGLITQVIVFSGTPVVKAGETVQKGDVLIKGVIQEAVSPTPAGEVAPPPVYRPVRAQGIVRARVWYDGYGEVPLRRIVFHRNGNRHVSVQVRIGSWQTTLQGVTPPDQHKVYETQVVEKSVPFWRNNAYPVETKLIITHELEAQVQDMTAEAAREEARAAALRQVQERVPENADVVARSIENISLPETDMVRVKVRVEAVEDIGQSAASVAARDGYT